MNTQKLPVPVLEYPHWRVNVRPSEYVPEKLQSLSECFDAIARAKVHLRGWDYPHLSHKHSQRGTGSNWVASWANYAGHIEYWRFYQSAQFLHLMAIREAANPDWRPQLEAQARGLLGQPPTGDWAGVPGFISILNFLYGVTEVFEFAARLAQHDVYSGDLTIRISIKGIRGFVLMAEFDRAWMNYYAATEDHLHKTWDMDVATLVAGSNDLALDATRWFFERFGWPEPSVEVLRKDQEKFLSGRL